MTPDSILELLKKVPYPGFSRDIVSFGLVKNVTIEDGIVSVQISVQTNDPKVPEQIFNNCHAILDPLPEVKHARIELDVQEPAAQNGVPGAASGAATKNTLPGIKHIIAVASGKVAWASPPSPLIWP